MDDKPFDPWTTKSFGGEIPSEDLFGQYCVRHFTPIKPFCSWDLALGHKHHELDLLPPLPCWPDLEDVPVPDPYFRLLSYHGPSKGSPPQKRLDSSQDTHGRLNVDC